MGQQHDTMQKGLSVHIPVGLPVTSVPKSQISSKTSVSILCTYEFNAILVKKD